MRDFPPRRIVCLTEETVETLYLLGEQDASSVSPGYAVRPPKCGARSRAFRPSSPPDMPKILALKPDLVLGFSDLQADIVAELVRSGVAVQSSTSATLPAFLR